MVAYVNLGCYYVVGIPIGYLLAYKLDLGVKVSPSRYSTFANYPYFFLSFLMIMIMDRMNEGNVEWYASWSRLADTGTHWHHTRHKLEQRGLVLSLCPSS